MEGEQAAAASALGSRSGRGSRLSGFASTSRSSKCCGYVACGQESRARTKEVAVARFFIGFLAPGASIRLSITVTNVFNPSGDWGPRFAMAHPRNPGAELRSTVHGKALSPASGRFSYRVTTTNVGPLGTFADVDF
jgi:hypothetical protein